MYVDAVLGVHVHVRWPRKTPCGFRDDRDRWWGFTHVRPVDRLMPASMVETGRKVSHEDTGGGGYVNGGQRIRTEHGIEGVVGESADLSPEAKCQQVEELVISQEKQVSEYGRQSFFDRQTDRQTDGRRRRDGEEAVMGDISSLPPMIIVDSSPRCVGRGEER